MSKSTISPMPATKANRLKKSAPTTAAPKAEPEITADIPATESSATEPTPEPTKKSKTKPAAKADKPNKIKDETPAKLSALDAAAKVLADAGTQMNTKAMIEAMANQKLWSSPGGKTPAATLYSAILREIDIKKAESRFRKASKGHFEATGK